MTTPAQVRAAWNTAIWNHQTILDTTARVFDHDVSPQSSGEEKNFYDANKRIHFFVYVVAVAERLRLAQTMEQRFTVEVRYFREVDPGGRAYNAVLDMFHTLHSLVRSELTKDWSGTVDFYRAPNNTPTIEQIVLDGRPTWRAVQRFEGVKQLAI